MEVVVGHQEFCFRHVRFDMPNRHLSVRLAFGCIIMEFWKKVWDRDKISSVDK